LSSKIEDITPKNGDKFVWSKAKDAETFEKEYNMKLVEVEGIFDFSLEKQIIRYEKGEKGVQTFVPFFTHLDANGKRCGIIVNRGWVPEDFKTYKKHYKSKQAGKISGVLYKGDHH
jgi:cytochrome oxidase assembly protein ShyY1